MSSLNILGHTSCTVCSLSKTRTNVAPGEGVDPSQASLVFVGEAPGKTEDEQGAPFVGPAGRLIKGIVFDGMGLDQRRVFWTNVYQCRPPHNDVSLAKGSLCPTIWLASELKRLPNMKVIIALGRTALTYFRPGTENESVRQLAARDTRWPHSEYGPYWVVGAVHPSYVLRQGVAEGSRDGNIALVSLVASLQRALYYLDDLPFYEDTNDAQ